jgi:hypothetical protein
MMTERLCRACEIFLARRSERACGTFQEGDGGGADDGNWRNILVRGLTREVICRDRQA